jgi:myo-inositol 2-dehydrogenase / D-chiro-inositol 1-dehydrogenase
MMANSRIRACLFGAGEMATIHAMNLISDPRVDLCYVVDPSAERATALATATGARAVDPDTAFADPAIDAWLIASPPRTHADYLERAATTHAYIFCEKPIDHDIARIRTCMAQLQGRETRVQMGFNRRFDFQFGQLKQAVDAGRIGRVEQVLIISRDPEAPEVEGFIHSSGLLKETAIHDFDLVRWLLEDEPAEVFVMGDALINPAYLTVGQIDTTTTTLRMAKGTHVTILNSLRASFGYDQRIEVLGSLGQASVGNVAQSLLVLSTEQGIRGEKPLWNYPQRYAQAYRAEILRFVECVANGWPVSPNAFDGLRASEMAEAAILSMNSGHPVAIAAPTA